jgi:hypothetical protein
MRSTIEMAREASVVPYIVGPTNTEYLERIERLVALVRADERMSFYGQDKPVECAEGCPPNQICDYCQVVAPVKAMARADEREACAKVCDDRAFQFHSESPFFVEMHGLADAIRARGETK